MEDRLRRLLRQRAEEFHMSAVAPPRLLRRARIRMALMGGVFTALVLGSGVGVFYGVSALTDRSPSTRPAEQNEPIPDAATLGKIAFAKQMAGNNFDIYLLDIGSGEQQRLTDDAEVQRSPEFSPDATRIAFEGFRSASGAIDGIFVMNVDGTDVQQVTVGQDPSWAPDGTKLAITNPVDGSIYVVNSDGTGRTQLTAGPDDYDPVWSPDGAFIAFIRAGELFVINSDGSNERSVTNASREADPAWSPDGAGLAFSRLVEGNSEIYIINLDGSGLQRVTQRATDDSQPGWSPDGSKIAFIGNVAGNGALFVMNSDGSNVRQIASDPGINYLDPDWFPSG